jgi:hypothetical protein
MSTFDNSCHAALLMTRKITGFIYYGLCGFINESHVEKRSINKVREEAKEILKGILEAEILTKKIYPNSCYPHVISLTIKSTPDHYHLIKKKILPTSVRSIFFI